MDAATFATALMSLGVMFGWQAMPDDQQQYEAIVQLDPELAGLLARGGSVPIAVEVPPEIQPIGRIRIVVGQGDLPRERLVTAMKPVTVPPGESIQLTQYNQPAAGLPATRYGQAAASSFDPYAKPIAGAAPSTQAGSSTHAAPAPTLAQQPFNPWTQPYQQASEDLRNVYQQAQQQTVADAQQWAQQQARALENQARDSAGNLLNRTQQAIDPNRSQASGPTADQLFGSGGSSASTPPWNANNNYYQNQSPQTPPASRPLRDGVERIDDRLRDVADNVSSRTRELFDHLGRPIRSLADRPGSFLPGRNDLREPATTSAEADPRYTTPTTDPYTPRANPYNNYWGVDGAQAPSNGQPTDNRSMPTTGYDPNDGLTAADRQQDDRDWSSARGSSAPWPAIPQVRRDTRDDPYYSNPSRWDLAERNDPGGRQTLPRRGETGVGASDRGPQLLGSSGQPMTPTIERQMLAAPASAPVEAVADGLLRFPSDPVGIDLSRQDTPGLGRDGTTSPFDDPVGGRPSAADLGWGEQPVMSSRSPADAASVTDDPFGRGGAGRPAGQSPGDRQQMPADASEDQQTSPWGILLAWLLLSGSFAGNVYLFWSYLDVRNKYSSLIRKSARSVGSRLATA